MINAFTDAAAGYKIDVIVRIQKWLIYCGKSAIL